MATEHERADAAMRIEADFTMPDRELIVVPAPDPAFRGQMLLDQMMARARLVPLGK